MTHPYWPPPKTRAPGHHRISVVMLIVAFFSGGSVGGYFTWGLPPEDHRVGASMLGAVAVALVLWWVGRRLIPASCPDCGTRLSCPIKIGLPSKGLTFNRMFRVSMPYKCNSCPFEYPANEAEEMKDLGSSFTWLFCLVCSAFCLVFVVASIAMVVIAAEQLNWPGLAIGIGLFLWGGGFLAGLNWLLSNVQQRSVEVKTSDPSTDPQGQSTAPASTEDAKECG